jgi:hypothetical protein
MQLGGKRRALATLLPGKALRTHCIGSCVGPRFVRKISPPPRFESRTVQPVGSRCTDYAIQANAVFCKISNENMADGRNCEAGAT